MAGDWIKMRVDLYRDPKIISMADVLMDDDSSLSRYVSQNTQRDSNVTRNVMRNAVVGALVSVWGIARVQGKRVDDDLLMESVTPAVLDDIADLPGIGDALLESRWVQESPDGLIFPRFFELYNEDYGDQKKKNRERQARYRAKKAKGRNVTVTSPVTSRNAPREEESRGEVKEEEKTPPVAGPVPEQDPGLDEHRTIGQPDIEIMFLAAWEAAEGRVRYPHAELSRGRRERLMELADSPAWNWRAALAKFPLRCTQGRPGGWLPSVGWFLKDDSVDSILEGAYDWSPDSPGSRDRLAELDRYAAADDEPEVIDVPNFADQFK